MRGCRGLLELRQRGGSGVGQHPGPGECTRAPGRESAWALASALSEELAELARGDQMAPSFWPLKNSNRNEPDALPGLQSATQGERIERQLLRGSERDLELEGDTRHRVERVVPGLGWDA